MKCHPARMEERRAESPLPLLLQRQPGMKISQTTERPTPRFTKMPRQRGDVASAASPSMRFFAVSIDLVLCWPLGQKGCSCLGLVEGGLGGRLALVPILFLAQGLTCRSPCSHLGIFLIGLASALPLAPASLLFSIKLFFAPTEILTFLTFPSGLSIWNGRMAQITDSRSEDQRGDTKAQRGHRE